MQLGDTTAGLQSRVLPEGQAGACCYWPLAFVYSCFRAAQKLVVALTAAHLRR